MSECYFCGKEAGYNYNFKNGKRSEASKKPRKYCKGGKCRKHAHFKMGGNKQIFKLSYSPYASGREIVQRKELLDKAKAGDETAILELRLRYGLRVIM